MQGRPETAVGDFLLQHPHPVRAVGAEPELGGHGDS